jgi:hypothetical protein
VGWFRRAVIASSRGPAAGVWRLAYRLAARMAAAFLRRGEEAGVYLRSGLARGHLVAGISDIDLSVIVRDEAAAVRVRDRSRILRRRLAWLGSPIECFHVETPETVALACRRNVFTHGLDGDGAGREHARMQERPVLTGQMSDWRRLAGPDLRPPDPGPWSTEQRPAVAWLDLQFWWRHMFVVVQGPEVPWLASSCVRLVAEPLRTALWLEGGDPRGSRAEVLERAGSEAPELEPAIRHAQELERDLHRFPRPDVELVVGAIRAATERAAAHLEGLVPGWTEVALEGEAPGPLLPLGDWRARALGSLNPFPSLLPLSGEIEPGRIAAACAQARPGVYPALGAGGPLMVLPTTDDVAGRLRGAECAVTDPVSHALARGKAVARFPDLPGWSARDCARTAAQAQAVRTAQGDCTEIELLGAARAALFLRSVEEGSPRLLLTAAAVERELGSVPALR